MPILKKKILGLTKPEIKFSKRYGISVFSVSTSCVQAILYTYNI